MTDICFLQRSKISRTRHQLVSLIKDSDRSPEKGMAFSVSMRHAFVPFTGKIIFCSDRLIYGLVTLIDQYASFF